MFKAIAKIATKFTCRQKLDEALVALNNFRFNLYNMNSYCTSSVLQKESLISANSNYGIITNSFKNYSTTPVLDATNFKDWTVQQVCSLLCADEAEGGYGLKFEYAKKLHDCNSFNGTSLQMVIENIMDMGEKEARKALIANRDYNQIPQFILEVIVKWARKLLKANQKTFRVRIVNFVLPPETYIPSLRSLFGCGDEVIGNIPSSRLVQTFGKDFEMRNVEQEVETFSKQVEVLIKILTETRDIDKQLLKCFVIASAPGTGKSRLNQELRRLSIEFLRDNSKLTQQQKEYLENSVHITTSFKNSTSFAPHIEKSPHEVLTYRILYSYFSRGCKNATIPSFVNFISQKQFPINIYESISIIRKDREQTNLLQEGEPLVIYFSIDEFQDILASEQFLDKQVKELCSAMFSCWEHQKVLLIPVYSGLSWIAIDRVLRESTTGYIELPRRPIDMIGIEEIAKSVFKKSNIPENLIYEDGMVYSYLKKTYGHPRSLEKTLEFLVSKYSPNNDWLSMENRQTLENELRVRISVSVKLSKLILAHAIIGTPLDYSDILTGKITVKELDDKGILKLDPVGMGRYRIVMSWYQFEVLASNLQTNREPLWSLFLESLNECIRNPNIKLFDDSFEKFRILFDMVLNRSFIYLGHTDMKLADRFRGFRYSIHEKDFFEQSTINLQSFPNKYSDTLTLLPRYMNHPRKDDKFFDCYGTANINNVSYLLGYQQTGPKNLNCRDFDKTVQLISNTIHEKYKSNCIVLLCLNHKLTDTTIPNRVMLYTSTVRNSQINGKLFGSTNSRTDMEVYFGYYIYNLAFSYLPS